MTVTVDEAVDWLYHGKSNVIKAAQACSEHPDTLKQLLLERVQTRPQFEPLQLSLTFHEKNL